MGPGTLLSRPARGQYAQGTLFTPQTEEVREFLFVKMGGPDHSNLFQRGHGGQVLVILMGEGLLSLLEKRENERLEHKKLEEDMDHNKK
jgi:hypothetical protein